MNSTPALGQLRRLLRGVTRACFGASSRMHAAEAQLACILAMQPKSTRALRTPAYTHPKHAEFVWAHASAALSCFSCIGPLCLSRNY